MLATSTSIVGTSKKGHAGYAHYLDCSTVGPRNVLSHLFLHSQAMGSHPFFCQQCDGSSHFYLNVTLHGLASGLFTLHDQPWCDNDVEMWLVLLLSVGFSKLGP